MAEKKRSIGMERQNIFWSFFSSVRLTLTLLIIIALVSILGTFIPQQDAAEEFIKGLPPAIASVLKTIQLFDLYHSIGFIVLLALLLLNLIVCSFNHFPVRWRLFRTTLQIDQESRFKSFPSDRMISIKGRKEDEIQKIEELFKARYGNLKKKVAPVGLFFYESKGAFSYFGVCIVHLSICLMIVGVVMGSLFGFEGRMNIVEGMAADAIQLKGNREEKKLGFEIRCDRFFVDFYNNGMPKDFRSDLSFLKDGQIAYQGPLRVNHPIEFDGLHFYQASYGMMPGGLATLRVFTGDGEEKTVKVKPGDTIILSERNARAEVLRVEEDLMELGPAVKLDVNTGNGHVWFWVLKDIREIEEQNPGFLEKVPEFNPAHFKPYVFALDRIESRFFTGIQVTRDPGAILVGAGAVLMILGFIVTFFTSHREVWVRVDEEGDRVRICVSGKSSRNPASMDREVKNILQTIRQRSVKG